ncbi:MAG: histidinol dehydrogenase [Dissulfurimicrobium hydrothermale]|uniref:histidinol dehydrogenase n=1 Tax=Dissulfurimicrobium hydrothermale TaxID=1750598 RepID=UPI003C7145AA
MIITPISYPSDEGDARINALCSRRFDIKEDIEYAVKEILKDVMVYGDDALVRYTRMFDAPDFSREDLKVTSEEMEDARSRVDENFLASLGKAIKNIEEFHRHELPNSWMMTRENGVVLGQMVRPVDAAGLYVPGGKGGLTPLVSSVLMNAIPAKIAGVKRIVLATPPNDKKEIDPHILAAASLCGINEIYKAGSAWAIGAMAYGTESIAPVDVVAGPGNIYVAAAKRFVSGLVGIDMIAGPSEVVIIADKGADKGYVAADLLSQAEHDPMATAVLITTDAGLGKDVAVEVERLAAGLERKETAISALRDNGLILAVNSLDAAVSLANRISPEHLELMVRDPWEVFPHIRHAGAIFLGDYTPEPVGDYIAGPNHVLPTMGTARFSSALGVETFLKRSSIISYTKKGFADDARDIIALAEKEGLTAHARSIETRLNSITPD